MKITIWRFEDAPNRIRRLSPHGGDEDWVALVPELMDTPMWMHEGTPFGFCSVTEHAHPDYPGFKILIGAHA